jgi:hypothetical protein
MDKSTGYRIISIRNTFSPLFKISILPVAGKLLPEGSNKPVETEQNFGTEEETMGTNTTRISKPGKWVAVS